jgi:hypothetical protein
VTYKCFWHLALIWQRFYLFCSSIVVNTVIVTAELTTCLFYLINIRVITKLPNSEQSNKGKVKTHKYINRQNQSTTGKLWKPSWPWLGTGISKEGESRVFVYSEQVRTLWTRCKLVILNVFIGQFWIFEHYRPWSMSRRLIRKQSDIIIP